MNQYSKKYSEEDYIKKCNELNVEYVGNHKEKKKGTIIEYICPNHKDKGVQCTDWSHFKTQKRQCKYCYGRNQTTEGFHKRILNQNIEFLSEFQGVENPIKCKCNDCGNIWTCIRPMDLIRRNGCPTCGIINRANKKRKSQEQFEKDLFNYNPNIKVIGKYTGTHKPIKCKCLIDDYEWESYASNLLNGTAGCPKCNNSIGENNIINFMEKYNIKYETQYKFEDCKDIQPLKFDVYDLDNNIAIEFQGEQHYYPIDFSGKGEKYALEAFNSLRKRDKIKKDYCFSNNIPLICIPYTERDNVESFLIDTQYKNIINIA